MEDPGEWKRKIEIKREIWQECDAGGSDNFRSCLDISENLNKTFLGA